MNRKTLRNSSKCLLCFTEEKSHTSFKTTQGGDLFCKSDQIKVIVSLHKTWNKPRDSYGFFFGSSTFWLPGISIGLTSIEVSIKMSYIFYVLTINQSLKSENMMTDLIFWMNYS